MKRSHCLSLASGLWLIMSTHYTHRCGENSSFFTMLTENLTIFQRWNLCVENKDQRQLTEQTPRLPLESSLPDCDKSRLQASSSGKRLFALLPDSTVPLLSGLDNGVRHDSFYYTASADFWSWCYHLIYCQQHWNNGKDVLVFLHR